MASWSDGAVADVSTIDSAPHREFSMNTIRINSNLIIDEETFHSVFSDALGFPSFYGKNMNAWIDCMGYLDEPAAEMSAVHVAPGEVLVLVIDGAVSFRARCPALYDELVECATFVNQRCVEAGGAPLLAITMHAKFRPKSAISRRWDWQ